MIRIPYRRGWSRPGSQRHPRSPASYDQTSTYFQTPRRIGYNRIRQQFVVHAVAFLNYDLQRRCVNILSAFGLAQKYHSGIAHRDELETPGSQESDESHVVKCQMVGDARSPTSTEWQIGRLGRGCEASLHEAFGKKAIRFWKIATVSVK